MVKILIIIVLKSYLEVVFTFSDAYQNPLIVLNAVINCKEFSSKCEKQSLHLKLFVWKLGDNV